MQITSYKRIRYSVSTSIDLNTLEESVFKNYVGLEIITDTGEYIISDAKLCMFIANHNINVGTLIASNHGDDVSYAIAPIGKKP